MNIPHPKGGVSVNPFRNLHRIQTAGLRSRIRLHGLLRVDVRPVEPDVGHRAWEPRPPAWIALLAHPPLAGIGEQRVHLAKANPLSVVFGGARQERKKRQADEA